MKHLSVTSTDILSHEKLVGSNKGCHVLRYLINLLWWMDLLKWLIFRWNTFDSFDDNKYNRSIYIEKLAWHWQRPDSAISSSDQRVAHTYKLTDLIHHLWTEMFAQPDCTESPNMVTEYSTKTLFCCCCRFFFKDILYESVRFVSHYCFYKSSLIVQANI